MTDKDTSLGQRFPRSPKEMDKLRRTGVEMARDLCAFVDASPTPYHAVAEVARRLEAGGFSPLSLADDFALSPADRRYITRGGTIIALIVGEEPPSSAGFRVVGAHTDSPNLRVKPQAEASKHGYRQVGVEVYGGALYSTWLDRDLSLAGRVLLRKDGQVDDRLIKIDAPIARVPNLAIHLNRGVNTDGLVLNAQKHMTPVLGLGAEMDLLTLLAKQVSEPEDAILGYDLSLYDTTKAAVVGVDEELVSAARLDNLASCHAALRALLAAHRTSPRTRVIVLYDHEECGSRSAVGAAGALLEQVLTRITAARPEKGADPAQAFARAMARSLLVSADMAHALHPNYADLHEPQHKPRINGGLVIKSNANQSYATDGETAANFEIFCEAVGYSPQHFVVRTDLPCGSTIGPITAARVGIATVDVGAPMLGMHSCRELAGTLDVLLAALTYEKALG